ncbi:MAG: hypothetical protein SOT07_04890 [Paludibacteraceae bacterium]|nr:hypothetical protein [Paludibacteraceae bacterium]
MGNGNEYNPSGGFSTYLYETVGQPVTINGYKCKIVQMKTDKGKNGYHAGLPAFANTSDIYVGLGPQNKPRQMRLYVNRKQVVDFDWGHAHQNSDGKKFVKGTVHVQRYFGAKGGDARYMSNSEIKKYGAIIKYFCPEVKLRP